MVVVVVLRRRNLDYERDRENTPLMLELGPRLVETTLRELRVKADGAGPRTNRNATMLVVMPAGAVLLIVAMATFAMVCAKRMAVDELLQILADDDQVPHGAEVRLEMDDLPIVTRDAVGKHRLMVSGDWPVGVEPDRVPIDPFRRSRINDEPRPTRLRPAAGLPDDRSRNHRPLFSFPSGSSVGVASM